MFECIKCKKILNTKNGLSNHQKFCNGIGTKKDIRKTKFFGLNWNKGNTYLEIYGKERADKIKNKISESVKNFGIWNKGLTKETNAKLLQLSKDVSKKLTGHKHTLKTKELLSIAAKKNKFGGYTHGGGRGKHGMYKGYWCDSSWELAYVIYNLEHNIPFKRNIKKFKYNFEEKEYFYIPDYKCGNIYVEIKGYESDKWKAKELQFPYKIKILKKDSIKKYLTYVIEKYGKDFIKLYET